MASRYVKDQPTGFVNAIKNVAIVGAAGQLGAYVTNELLKTNKFTVTAITRTDSKNNPPQGVKTVIVNYDDHNSLVNALRGQDALVITMNVMAPKDSVAKLVEAAIDAGVPWILPNEWGGDYTDVDINKDTMLGNDKLEIRRLVESKSQNSAWIAVACGFWYEYSLPGGNVTFGFDFDKKVATFYDDGNFKMYYSTLSYCGQAVAKLLSLPILPENESDMRPCLADYRNKICRVQAFHLNQKDMLASILRVTGEKESDWIIQYDTSKARYEEGKEMLQGGNRIGFRQMLYTRMFYPSNPTKTAQDYSDEQLGMQKPLLDDMTKSAVDEIEKVKA